MQQEENQVYYPQYRKRNSINPLAAGLGGAGIGAGAYYLYKNLSKPKGMLDYLKDLSRGSIVAAGPLAAGLVSNAAQLGRAYNDTEKLRTDIIANKDKIKNIWKRFLDLIKPAK